jgi:hypothetical protein
MGAASRHGLLGVNVGPAASHTASIPIGQNLHELETLGFFDWLHDAAHREGHSASSLAQRRTHKARQRHASGGPVPHLAEHRRLHLVSHPASCSRRAPQGGTGHGPLSKATL